MLWPEALRTWLPHVIAENIVGGDISDGSTLKKKGLPKAHRLKCACVFADVAGFTYLSERLASDSSSARGCEALAKLLNSYFSLLVRIVTKNGGDVFKYAGDAVIVLWPSKDGDISMATRRAAQCCLEIQEHLHEAKLEADVMFRVKLGIGVGTAHILHMGGESDGFVPNRIEFIACGKPLQEAFQAEQEASPGDIIASADAWSYLEEAFSGHVASPGSENTKVTSQTLLLRKRRLMRRRTSSKRISFRSTMNLWSYVPQAILPFLIVENEMWMSEVRWVTSLFISMSASSKLHDLNEFHEQFSALQRTVFDHQGTVNKVLVDDKGATVIVVFGLPPLAHENDATRGVLAALHICSVLTTPSVGVTSGNAFCGMIGSRGGRREYSVLGDSINVAARLMQRARHTSSFSTGSMCITGAPIGCLVDYSTMVLAKDDVHFERLDTIVVKGKRDPLRVYQPYRSYNSVSTINDTLSSHGWTDGVSTNSSAGDSPALSALSDADSAIVDGVSLESSFAEVCDDDGFVSFDEKLKDQVRAYSTLKRLTLQGKTKSRGHLKKNSYKDLFHAGSNGNQESTIRAAVVNGQVCVLSGRVGAGKSRLLSRVYRSIAASRRSSFSPTRFIALCAGANPFEQGSLRRSCSVWLDILSEAILTRTLSGSYDSTPVDNDTIVAQWRRLGRTLMGFGATHNFLNRKHVLALCKALSCSAEALGLDASSFDLDASFSEKELKEGIKNFNVASLGDSPNPTWDLRQYCTSETSGKRTSIVKLQRDQVMEEFVLSLLVGAMAELRSAKWCIFIDDAHNMDPDSCIICSRIQQLSEANVVAAGMVLACRPVASTRCDFFSNFYRHLCEQESTVAVQTSPFSEPQIATLIKSQLGVLSIPNELASDLTEQSQGNPLFAKVLLTELVSNGLLEVNTRTKVCQATSSVATEWAHDRFSLNCMRCHKPFTAFTRRRHHCRRCGGLFCASCAPSSCKRIALGYVHPVRHCRDCFDLPADLPRRFSQSSINSMPQGAIESTSPKKKRATLREKGLRVKRGSSSSSHGGVVRGVLRRFSSSASSASGMFRSKGKSTDRKASIPEESFDAILENPHESSPGALFRERGETIRSFCLPLPIKIANILNMYLEELPLCQLLLLKIAALCGNSFSRRVVFGAYPIEAHKTDLGAHFEHILQSGYIQAEADDDGPAHQCEWYEFSQKFMPTVLRSRLISSQRYALQTAIDDSVVQMRRNRKLASSRSSECVLIEGPVLIRKSKYRRIIKKVGLLRSARWKSQWATFSTDGFFRFYELARKSGSRRKKVFQTNLRNSSGVTIGYASQSKSGKAGCIALSTKSYVIYIRVSSLDAPAFDAEKDCQRWMKVLCAGSSSPATRSADKAPARRSKLKRQTSHLSEYADQLSSIMKRPSMAIRASKFSKDAHAFKVMEKRNTFEEKKIIQRTVRDVQRSSKDQPKLKRVTSLTEYAWSKHSPPSRGLRRVASHFHINRKRGKSRRAMGSVQRWARMNQKFKRNSRPSEKETRRASQHVAWASSNDNNNNTPVFYTNNAAKMKTRNTFKRRQTQ